LSQPRSRILIPVSLLLAATLIGGTVGGRLLASPERDTPPFDEYADILTTLAEWSPEAIAPEKFVWVHAQNEKDHAVHAKLALAGAWVSLDGINAKSAGWHLQCVRFMAARGLLGRVLLSQDSGWYRVGQPGGGDFRPYTYIYTDFLPKLEAAWRGRLMWDNPRLCFGR
jgi:phosphotriesterase-related protein